MTDAFALLVESKESDIGVLHGCVNAANEFRGWLASRGVRQGRIRLLGTPDTARPYTDDIIGAVKDIKQDSGQTLFLFWAGHSADDKTDAVSCTWRTVSLHAGVRPESLLEELQADSGHNFPEQFIFVDHCDGIRKTGKRVVFQARFRFPDHPRGSTKQQYAFFATQSGRSADYLRSRRIPASFCVICRSRKLTRCTPVS